MFATRTRVQGSSGRCHRIHRVNMLVLRRTCSCRPDSAAAAVAASVPSRLLRVAPIRHTHGVDVRCAAVGSGEGFEGTGAAAQWVLCRVGALPLPWTRAETQHPCTHACHRGLPGGGTAAQRADGKAEPHHWQGAERACVPGAGLHVVRANTWSHGHMMAYMFALQ